MSRQRNVSFMLRLSPFWALSRSRGSSGTGVGAVLSQWCEADEKLHPFFSRRLTPMEWNYDMSNRELLALVLALQEWRHWLEKSCGLLQTTRLVVVWTDHKNLAFIQSARCLKSRQPRWALFLGRLRFTLMYRPESKNIKPHALSCQFAVDQPTADPTLHSSAQASFGSRDRGSSSAPCFPHLRCCSESPGVRSCIQPGMLSVVLGSSFLPPP